MGEIKTTLTLADKITSTLRGVRATMAQVTTQANLVNTAIYKQDTVMSKTAQSTRYYLNAANKVVTAQGKFVSAAEFAATGLRKEDLALRKVNRTAKYTSATFGDLGRKMKGAMSGMRGLLGGIALSTSALSLAKQSDEYANMNARLKMINDGLSTTKQLQNSIYKSAQLTGSTYNDVANGVAKMRMQAGEVFTNNGETLAFLETMNKSFVVGGASIEEQKSAMLQLTQAMASGKLQGDELRSLAETSPALIQAISDHLGVSRGEIKKLGAEGKLTADVVKNSMLAATDKINGEFERMPLTFARAWQQFKNYSLVALEPVLVELNRIVNSPHMAQFGSIIARGVNVGAQALHHLLNVASVTIDIMASGGQLIANNWDLIAPPLFTIVGLYSALKLATLGYKGAVIAMNTAEAINVGIKGALAGVTTVKAAASMMATGATFAETAAQQGLNAAFLACPVTWVVLGVIALIGALYAGVAAYNRLTGASISATGIIVGALFAVGAVAKNVITFIVNFGIGTAQALVNAYQLAGYGIQLAWFGIKLGFFTASDAILNAGISAAEWLVNTYFDLSYNVQSAFHQMGLFITTTAQNAASVTDSVINACIGGIENMINRAIDGLNKIVGFANKVAKVFGGEGLGTISHASLGRSNLAGSFGGSSLAAPTKHGPVSFGRSSLASNVGDAPQMPEFTQLQGFEYASIGDAYNSGYGKGEGLADKVSNFFSGKNNDTESPADLMQQSQLLDSLESLPGAASGGAGGGKGGNPTGGKLDSIGKIDDEIAIDDEVIKLIKDVANQEYQQKFIKLEPKIVTNIGEIKNERQYANVLDDLNAKIIDAINNGADGI